MTKTTKTISIVNPRYRTRAYEVRSLIESCRMSAWALDQMCVSAEREGAVTIERLIDMREQAAHALQMADLALVNAHKVTGKSVIG